MNFKEYYLIEANIYDVRNFKGVLRDVVNHCFTRGHFDESLSARKIREWFLTHYANWFQSSQNTGKGCFFPHVYERGEPEWAKKDDVVDFTGFNGDQYTEISHIVDYFCGLPKIELSKIHKEPINVIRQKVAQWNEQLKKQMLLKQKALVEDVDYRILMQFPDGYKWILLTSKQAYQNEGDQMGHCVAGYWDDERPWLNFETTIYSLRDQNMEPHITIEVDPMGWDKPCNEWLILQVQGKQNKKPKPEYLKYYYSLINKYDILDYYESIEDLNINVNEDDPRQDR